MLENMEIIASNGV